MNQTIVNEYYTIIKNKISQCNFESALASVDKLLSNFPNDDKGYYYKAVCMFAKEKYDEALKNYKLALKINPAFGKAYFNIAICYYLVNKYDLALINFGKALIIFSKSKELDSKQRCKEAFNLIQSERRDM